MNRVIKVGIVFALLVIGYNLGIGLAYINSSDFSKDIQSAFPNAQR